MHILVGLGMAVALLYFWLIGHWFARVLMVILLVPAVGFAIACLFATAPGVTPVGAAFGGLIGAIAGWFLAGWPAYYWEARNRRYTDSLRGHPMQDWHRIQY